ncbi:hypothetical protein ACQPZ2_27295 [Nocardia pseudovaccinii]|uniref:hypothetical protein n=1 Tax=Nocardia pseudovaccinii TaxID=189540 RepID=UPI003D8D6617
MNEMSHRLPDISVLRDRCRALAMLDAIVSPEWADRYYSFNSDWAEDEEMASMRNGSGDDWFIVFSPTGVYGRAFDHEAPKAPEVLAAVPVVFDSYIREPAFADHNGTPMATACFWRTPDDAAWGVSAASQSDAGLFDLLVDGTPEAYQHFAADYYETDISLSAVQHVYALHPLTATVVAEINPDVELDDLDEDIDQIGYPR